MENNEGISPGSLLNSNDLSPAPEFNTGGDVLVADRLRGNLRNMQMSKMIRGNNLDLDEEKEEEDYVNAECVAEKLTFVLKHWIIMYLSIFVLLVFMMCCLMWNPIENQTISTVTENIELCCNIFFLLLLAGKFFLLRKEQSIFWLVFDLITIICGFVGYAVPDFEVQRYFKAIRAFKMLFLIKEIQILNEPASYLLTALAKIGNVLIPALFIIYIYAVVGLYSFSDFQYSRCRTQDNKLKTADWTVYQNQVFLCGQLKCPYQNGQQYECLNPLDYGVEPNSNELVNMMQGNGLLQYSNIFYAFLSTFKQTFVTGSSRLIILYKQALNPAFIQIYYYSYIYLISYIYLNIFYSLIITAEWDNQENEIPKTENPASDFKTKLAIESAREIKKQKTEKEESDKSNKKQKQGERKKVLKQFHAKEENSDEQNNGEGKHSSRVVGNLVLQKTKNNNIFKDVEENYTHDITCVNFKEKAYEQIYNEPEQEEQAVDEKATLFSEYPNEYKKYTILSNFLVILCCLNLCMDFQGQDSNFKFIIDIIDFVFYCLFILEIGLVVLLQRLFLRRIQFWTKVQAFLAILCTVGVFIEAFSASTARQFFSSQNLTSDVFRSFKFLRIMVMLFNTPFFLEARLILESTFRSLYNIKNVVLLWLLIVLTFGIVGFHLHAYKTKVNDSDQLDMENGQGYQISFDGTFDAIIFTALTFYNQQWDYLMFQQYLGSGTLIVIWQLISICVGLILFSKYFMALLMKQLDALIDEDFEKGNQIEIGDNQTQIETQLSDQPTPQDQDQAKIALQRRLSKQRKRRSARASNQINQITAVDRIRKMPSKRGNKRKTVPAGLQNETIQNQGVRRCLFILRRMVEHRFYKTIYCIVIFGSCLVLINLHPHVHISSSEAQPYVAIDYACKIFFILDLILQLVVYGLFQSQNSYIRRSKLNILNIIIIILEIISFSALRTNYIFMKIQKVKVLRVSMFVELRYKSDWGMRMTFHAFLELLPKVLTLLTVTILMYGYFALILVKAFKNDFFNCTNYATNATTIVTKNDCLMWGGDWVQLSMNTSNLFNSVLFLFSVATMEGWISMMQPMMNLVGTDFEPVLDNNKYVCLFFVFFFFFGNLIMLNVFVGLSVSNFKRLKDITTGEARLSKIEKMWLSVKSQIYRLTPLVLQTRPTNTLRGYAYDVSNHYFYKIVQGFLFISFMISMSLYKTNMAAEERNVLNRIKMVFVIILIIEYIIQFLAFGIRTEYKRSFIYKNVVVIYCTVYEIMFLTLELNRSDERIFGGISMALQFFRYLSRNFVFYLVLDEIPFARKLLNSLLTILPQTTNIALIILVTLFIYAIIGMEMFAFLRPNIQLDAYNQNYTDFPSALFALIKFSTMQSPIQQISDAAQLLSPNFICEEIYSYQLYQQYGQIGCGNRLMSYIFFLSFHIFYSLLLMATLMAVIVDGYSEVKKEENAFITKFVLEKVRNQWSKIDPQATGYLPYREFWMFTAKLIEIYVGKDDKKKAQDSLSQLYSSREDFLKSLEIPIYENQNGVLCFQFHQVIESLTRTYISNNLGTRIKSKKAEKMFKERQSNIDIGFKKSFYTSSHVATLIILKSGLRWWKKLATNEKGRMQYKNIIGKFSNNVKQAEQPEQP